MKIGKFHKNVIKFWLCEIILVTPILAYYYFDLDQGNFRSRLLILFAYLCIQIAIVATVFKDLKILDRLIEINPYFKRTHGNAIWLIFFWLSPIGIIFLLSYLLLARKSKTRKKPVYFFQHLARPGGTIALSIFIPIVLEIASFDLFGARHLIGMSQLSYWISSPTTHHLVRVIEEVNHVVAIKREYEKSKSTTDTMNRFEEYFEDRSYSVTGLTLAMAVMVMGDMNERKAAKDKKSSVDSTDLNFIEHQIRLGEIWESAPSPFLTSNPLSLYNPIGALEAVLGASVYFYAEEQFRLTWVSHLKQIFALAIEDPAVDPVRLNQLRARFEETRLYRLGGV